MSEKEPTWQDVVTELGRKPAASEGGLPGSYRSVARHLGDIFAALHVAGMHPVLAHEPTRLLGAVPETAATIRLTFTHPKNFKRSGERLEAAIVVGFQSEDIIGSWSVPSLKFADIGITNRLPAPKVNESSIRSFIRELLEQALLADP